jgi:hypothetical protein
MITGNIMIGSIGAVKKKQDQYVFNVYEMGDVSEDSGQAEYKKVKVLKVRRADQRGARDVAYKTMRAKDPNKNYFIELATVNYG